MGDLFLTKENIHGRPPVIGFFEYTEGVTRISTVPYGRTSYFMPVPIGTIGIYFRKNLSSNRSGGPYSPYWDKFHEVWINGKQCLIHEQFINPMKKVAKNG